MQASPRRLETSISKKPRKPEKIRTIIIRKIKTVVEII